MSDTFYLRLLTAILKWLPLLFLVIILLVFGSVSPRFLSAANLSAILTQASWLAVLALGVNLVLVSAGVDLSIGAIMYFVVVLLGLTLPTLPITLWLPAALFLGGLVGLSNGWLVTRIGLPAFIATLAMAFIIRGLGLWLSDTQMVLAPDVLASLGRAKVARVSMPILIALGAFAATWILLGATPFGLYLRAIGADREAARRAGIPRRSTLLLAYALSGGLAGVAGTISFAQTAAATAAFGLNADFLAIAASVLGGTSLFGGRGSAIAPAFRTLRTNRVRLIAPTSEGLSHRPLLLEIPDLILLDVAIVLRQRRGEYV